MIEEFSLNQTYNGIEMELYLQLIHLKQSLNQTYNGIEMYNAK